MPVREISTICINALAVIHINALARKEPIGAVQIYLWPYLLTSSNSIYTINLSLSINSLISKSIFRYFNVLLLFDCLFKWLFKVD